MDTKLVVQFNTKAVHSSGEFEGYGAVFDNVDLGDDIIKRGAFTKSLAEYKTNNSMPSLLWQHRTSEPVGDWLEISEDEKGLFVKGALWVTGNVIDATPLETAAQARNLIRGRGHKGLSIGYGATEWKIEERDGRRVRIISEVKLYEISIVTFAMNQEAVITDAKNAQTVSIRDAEKALRDAGMSQTEAKKVLSLGYKAGHRDDDNAQRDAVLTELILTEQKENETLKGLI